MKERCLSAISEEKTIIIQEFPKYENLTNSIFAEITDFANEDFDGISDNKRYRLFLDLCENILITAFEQDASKAYLRAVFKALKNGDISKHFSCIMQSKADEFQTVTNGLLIRFIYSWQGMVPFNKEKKLKELLDLLKIWR